LGTHGYGVAVAAEGNGDTGVDVVDQPLPEMDREELRRLRAIIGPPGADSAPTRPRGQGNGHGRPEPSPLPEVVNGHNGHARYEGLRSRSLAELLEEIDRKLEKLLDAGPEPIFTDFVGQALVSVQSEIDVLRGEMRQLQSSLDQLSNALLG
jgi:hypothetical protein